MLSQRKRVKPYRFLGQSSNKNSDFDILISFEEGESPYSLLELLSVEKHWKINQAFGVEIVNEIDKKRYFKAKYFCRFADNIRAKGIFIMKTSRISLEVALKEINLF